MKIINNPATLEQVFADVTPTVFTLQHRHCTAKARNHHELSVYVGCKCGYFGCIEFNRAMKPTYQQLQALHADGLRLYKRWLLQQ